MSYTRLAQFEPPDAGHSRNLRLAIDPTWIVANRRRHRSARALPFAAVAVVAFLLFSGPLVDPLVRLETGVLAVCVASLGLLIVVGTEATTTGALRFRGSHQPFLMADADGVYGDVYPLERYHPISSPEANRMGLSPTVVVVRSRVLGRVLEVAEKANLVPWGRITIVAGPLGKEIRVRFWSGDVKQESWILHDISCVLPAGDLLELLFLASQRGADVHLDNRLLTQQGREAIVQCPRHDIATVRRPPGKEYSRLRNPISEGEGAAWLDLPGLDRAAM